jgi:hypothetical protein
MVPLDVPYLSKVELIQHLFFEYEVTTQVREHTFNGINNRYKRPDSWRGMFDQWSTFYVGS